MSEKSYKGIQDKMINKEVFSPEKNRRRNFDDLKELLEDMYSQRSIPISDPQKTLGFKTNDNCINHNASTPGGVYYPSDNYKSFGVAYDPFYDTLFTAPYPGPSWPEINQNTGAPNIQSFEETQGSYCGAHLATTYNGINTFESFSQKIDDDLIRCSCNAVTHQDNLCTSRTARNCACKSRTYYVCDCQSRHTCRSRSTTCGCRSRYGCGCYVYSGGYYNNTSVCACDAQGPSIPSCYCNVRTACKTVKHFLE